MPLDPSTMPEDNVEVTWRGATASEGQGAHVESGARQKRRPNGMAESSTRTAKKRGLGRPFQPGQSGNPGGRPKGVAERVQTVVGEDGAKLVQALWLIAQGSSEQRRAFFGDSVKVTVKDRMDAITVLLDRGFGKASQTVALTGAEGGPLVVGWMSGSDA